VSIAVSIAAAPALSRPGHNSGLREYAEFIAASAGDFAVTSLARSAAVALLAATLAALAPSALANKGWMTEAAMRDAFIGKTLDGYYMDGQTWTETYNADGRLDYRDDTRNSLGQWYFRAHVFCTFYDPGQGVTGGCFTAVQTSANCYEFYLAALSEREADKEAAPGPVGRWVARAARRGEPSTCQARPTV
jgi:hypothetical protein